MPCDAHANHPKRLAALKRGKKRFKGPQCVKNPDHIWRFVSSGKCADCADARNLEKTAAKPTLSRMPSKPRSASCTTVRTAAVEKSETRLPMIGSDLDDDANVRRLTRTTNKFLQLLMVEKLDAIRSGACPQ
jgi:hypothetical protein